MFIHQESSQTPLKVNGRTFRLIWIATKGDWPFLRKEPRLNLFLGQLIWFNEHMDLGISATKACCLYTGFSSLRICHLCNGQDYRAQAVKAW